MITNLEIDASLAAQLESAAKARGIGTRDFIRNALRQALSDSEAAVAPARFEQRVHDFGTDIETPWTLLVDLQTDEYMRKLNRK